MNEPTYGITSCGDGESLGEIALQGMHILTEHVADTRSLPLRQVLTLEMCFGRTNRWLFTFNLFCPGYITTAVFASRRPHRYIAVMTANCATSV